ncbi:MAG: tetratricopeptide repeat protein [Saprospirales bacterium]|nr:tetratricopeptide repeat protein [Saprospirales bacterium]MBK8493286.1 tetratricopeptide repeat protein [Saprospirales bacterium]
MRSTLIATLLLLAFLACNNGPDPEMNAITVLEKELETNASADKIEALMGLYEQYVAAHPDEVEADAQYLHKAAYVQYTGHRYASAVKYLKEALRNFYPSTKTPDNALFLASIYKNEMKNPEVGNAAYYAFLQAFPNHEKASFVRDSVLTDSMDLHAEIDSLRSRIYNENTNRYDAQVSNEFIGTCEVYGLLLPEDPKTPDLVFEAARTAGYIRSFPKAVELYDWVYTRYPDYSKASQALFMMAFTYDNEMGNVDRAKGLYEEFLQKYPNDDFADDAQALFQNLGKSEEEILKALQKK